MHNRGNGKGGGIAAVGFDPDQLGISREVLESHYCLQIAALDPECIEELAAKHIRSVFDIAAESKLKTVKNWQELPSLEVRPPDIFRYFVRVKPDALDAFINENKLQAMDREKAEDEFVYQNSLKLNGEYYASLGEKKAFVVSQGRNMLVLKIVGYAEDVVRYYCMDDFKAHVWIAHQRFPTKGRVWHPGGAHPFAGLDDALVHNGDFANYQSMVDYLKQRGLRTMFLTDTEVAILVFDYLSRVHNYPLEYIIEALAPTTEMDFDLLPKAKQEIYRKIQIAHMHGSPDGPWFFIIARNNEVRARIPAARDHRHRDAAAAGLRGAERRGPDRPGLLREAGDRRDAQVPGGRGPALLHGRRQVLERPRRQQQQRRLVHLQHQGRPEQPDRQDADLRGQVRQPGDDARGADALRRSLPVARLRAGMQP